MLVSGRGTKDKQHHEWSLKALSIRCLHNGEHLIAEGLNDGWQALSKQCRLWWDKSCPICRDRSSEQEKTQVCDVMIAKHMGATVHLH